MIIIDSLTLILCAVALLSALLTPLMNPFFRRLRKEEPPTGSSPNVTILLVCNGDATALDEHLPHYLTQDYSGEYQVIVVGEKADAETVNVLKRYANDPKLYSTFIPESARYMSRNKLAITLGVKASEAEWIILSDPRCKPESNQWLKEMAARMDERTHMVLGYTRFADDAKAFHRFEHLHTALYLLRAAQNGHAYRSNCMNLAFRKSDFMSRNGFLEYLKYSVGEYDFMVNKYASDGVHLLFNTDQWLMHLNYLFLIGMGIFAGMTSRWILLGVAVVALAVTLTLRTLIGKKALKEYGVNLPAYQIVPFELRILWHQLTTLIRYENADKYDFISHKG